MPQFRTSICCELLSETLRRRCESEAPSLPGFRFSVGLHRGEAAAHGVFGHDAR